MCIRDRSTVGVILAKELGFQFVDSDLLIQRQEKRLLKQIIEEDGIDGFIEIENQVNRSIDTHNAVIATGGSVVYGREAMENLGRIGKIVYLRLSYEKLQERLGNLHGRGVIVRKGQTLLDIYKERIPLYEQYADLVINEEDKNIEETLQTILESLGQ